MQTLQKIHSGELYLPMDEKLLKQQLLCMDRTFKYNSIKPSKAKKRQKMLIQMFGDVGKNCYVEAPIHANWGCKNVHLGDNVYINFNLTLVDDTHIYIGDNTMIAPNVTLATGTHPISPEKRAQGYQYNKPITIGKNCWIGANAVVLPGVTIGDNSVIGAGSVVTKDIPAGVVAMGNPCKIYREIPKD